MSKPVAIPDTKEIDNVLLTGMDESLLNCAFNFRFYSFIHTDRGQLDY